MPFHPAGADFTQIIYTNPVSATGYELNTDSVMVDSVDIPAQSSESKSEQTYIWHMDVPAHHPQLPGSLVTNLKCVSND